MLTLPKKESLNPAIHLPRGYEISETFSGLMPTRADGLSILRDYCSSCEKRGNCELTNNLGKAMANNFSYWPEQFIPIKVPTRHKMYTASNYFSSFEIKTICTEYESAQKRLPGMPTDFVDGVARVLQIAQDEKERYIAKYGDNTP